MINKRNRILRYYVNFAMRMKMKKKNHYSFQPFYCCLHESRKTVSFSFFLSSYRDPSPVSQLLNEWGSYIIIASRNASAASDDIIRSAHRMNQMPCIHHFTTHFASMEITRYFEYQLSKIAEAFYLTSQTCVRVLQANIWYDCRE